MSHFVRREPPDSFPATSSNTGGCRYFIVGFGLAMLGILVLVILGLLAYVLWSARSALPVAEPPAGIAGPEVVFQEPAPGTQILVGESVLVFATARDANRITRMDLWVDDQLAIQQSAPDPNGVTPFSLIHSLVATKPGAVGLMVRAYGSQGALGESPVLYVTVLAPVASAPTQPPVAEQTPVAGQTPSVGEIPPGGQPPAPPVAPPAIPPVVPPAIPSGLPEPLPPHPPLPPNPSVPPIGWLPGLIPQAKMIPGPVPGQPGEPAKVILPGLMPGAIVKNVLNPPNARVDVPVLQNAQAKDCAVTLTWTWADPSAWNVNFLIFRRAIPGDSAPKYVEKIDGKQTTYRDTVSKPGDYEYTVRVIGFKQSGQAATNFEQVSNPKQVKVLPSAGCITAPSEFKYIYFQPLAARSKGAETYGAFYYSIANSARRRVPSPQGQFDDWNNWLGVGKEAIPAPVSVYLDPGAGVTLNLEAEGYTAADWSKHLKGPADLGAASASHSYADLISAESKNKVRRVDGDKFWMLYRIWLEDVKWTGQGTTDQYASPMNLRVLRTTPATRVLGWDWNGETSMLEGFRLYRSYSCPGEDTLILAPRALPATPKEFAIDLKSEPAGCAFLYWVTAYGRAGESGRSNFVNGLTVSAAARVQVTFKDIEVGGISHVAKLRIGLAANDHHRSAIWYSAAGVHNLGGIFQAAGLKDQNVIAVDLTEDEFLGLTLYVSSFDEQGFRSEVCQMGTIVPPVRTWKNPEATYPLSKGDCRATVIVKALGAPPPPPPPPDRLPTCARPEITFKVSPTTITAGASATLSWSVTNATEVLLDDGTGKFKNVPTSGTEIVKPTATTFYNLNAMGCGTTALAQARVEVKAAAPPSGKPPACQDAPAITFEAAPQVIATGQSATLKWTTKNVSQVVIDQGIGAQQTSGSRVVSPSTTTTYVMKATACDGTVTLDRQVMVIVKSAAQSQAGQLDDATCTQPANLYNLNCSNTVIMLKMLSLTNSVLPAFIQQISDNEAKVYGWNNICTPDPVTWINVCYPVPIVYGDTKTGTAQVTWSDGTTQSATVYAAKWPPVEGIYGLISNLAGGLDGIKDPVMKEHARQYLGRVRDFVTYYYISDGNAQGVPAERERRGRLIADYFNNVLLPYVRQHP